MGKIKLSAIQMSCTDDKKKNLEKGVKLVEMAAERGGKIICLQELFTTHWFPKEVRSTHFRLSEKADGETVSTLREVAKRTGTVIVAPFFEEGVDGVYYNSAAVIDSSGDLLGIYRKVHLPQLPCYEERYYFTGGDKGFPVFDTAFGKIGVQICWDNFYPEGARILALKGAELIVAPTAAAFASQERWRTVLSAAAITNGLFILRANRVGKEEKHEFYGQSFCLDPCGELIGQPSGSSEGVFEAIVDLSEVRKTRQVFPYLKERRPEAYGEIAGLELAATKNAGGKA